MGNKQTKKQGKKRKFANNQHTRVVHKKQQDTAPEPEPHTFKKIRVKQTTCEADGDDQSCFLFMDHLILKTVFEKFSVCKECSSKLLLTMDDNKMGYAHKMFIACSQCGFSEHFFTSPNITSPFKSPGLAAFEINYRATMAFREIGRGHKALKTFSAMMNMAPPMTVKNFNEINCKLSPLYINCAEENKRQAAVEVHKLVSPENPVDELVDCQISLDGSWQKRGYSSLNGVVAAVAHSNKKVIDTIVLSKFCKQCEIWEKRKDSPAYNEWKNNHHCTINHTGSSGSMESVGAIEIFQSSVHKYNLRYSHYLGDGDTGSFNKVLEAKPYGEDLIPQKLECVGHIQKRVGSRLRSLRKSLKGVKLEDGKGIIGKGRLTDKSIDTLQNYFGMAIRQNKGNLLCMRNSIIAILYHCSDFESNETRHMYCPKDPSSWCKWQIDRKKHTNKLNLPLSIHNKIKPIFQDLSKEELLLKCLHGETQNVNEAFNQLIWDRSLKTKFSSKRVVEMAVSSAVINFNSGMLGMREIFTSVGFASGKYFDNSATLKDMTRLKKANRKEEKTVKDRRKKLRSIKKGYIDTTKEKEGGDSYNAGSF